MKNNGLGIKVSHQEQLQTHKQILIFYYLNLVAAVIYLALSWIQFFYPEVYSNIASTVIYIGMLSAYNAYKEMARNIYGKRLKKKKGGIWFYIWLINIVVMLYWQKNSAYSISSEVWIGFWGIVTNYLVGKYAKHYKRKNGIVD